ncbi:cell division protein ZapB [Candidatus Fukatsuia symbiotica]|uniref:Septal ring assembly protein ZapB n=1 Tax=Candidatus Fukatsuia symbiotica TaxID=1878942 RepID=A0A2U8I2T7_9GAMM|nr:cell division protein ZapB [Candidatus Fukatsuia symbiotica]AWK13423.1 septal ring assembly protein ZapB [Candidatus Fukatsuia symbiotica]MEA9444315.1 cell division protein ZapB [Candidatus Fukatsuia symbiotica]
MAFEVFEKLEAKVQQTIDTITLLKMEIEELKEQNRTQAEKNEQLKREEHVLQERLGQLLSKIEGVEEI